MNRSDHFTTGSPKKKITQKKTISPTKKIKIISPTNKIRNSKSSAVLKTNNNPFFSNSLAIFNPELLNSVKPDPKHTI